MPMHPMALRLYERRTTGWRFRFVPEGTPEFGRVLVGGYEGGYSVGYGGIPRVLPGVGGYEGGYGAGYGGFSETYMGGYAGGYDAGYGGSLRPPVPGGGYQEGYEVGY